MSEGDFLRTTTIVRRIAWAIVILFAVNSLLRIGARLAGISKFAEGIHRIGVDQPLPMAIIDGDAKKVAELLARKGNPNSAIEGEPLLYFALSHEFSKCSRLLIENGADVNVRVKKYNGQTPLMALVAGMPDAFAFDLAKLMLEKGADPTIADEKGNNAIVVAEKEGRPRLAAYLGKKPWPPEFPTAIDKRLYPSDLQNLDLANDLAEYAVNPGGSNAPQLEKVIKRLNTAAIPELRFALDHQTVKYKRENLLALLTLIDPLPPEMSFELQEAMNADSYHVRYNVARALFRMAQTNDEKIKFLSGLISQAYKPGGLGLHPILEMVEEMGPSALPLEPLLWQASEGNRNLHGQVQDTLEYIKEAH